jgi:hypothetical protein
MCRARGFPGPNLIDAFSSCLLLQGLFSFLPVIAYIPVSDGHCILWIHGFPFLVMVSGWCPGELGDLLGNGDAQDATLAASLTLACTLKEIDCNRKEFFPAGINAGGTGVRSGLQQEYLNGSHAHSLGSWISGWCCQKSGSNPH